LFSRKVDSKSDVLFCQQLHTKLLLPIHQLSTYGKIITAMGEMTSQLNHSAQRLSDHLSMNHTSLRRAIETLLRDANDAEKYLSTQGPNAVYNVSRGDFCLHSEY